MALWSPSFVCCVYWLVDWRLSEEWYLCAIEARGCSDADYFTSIWDMAKLQLNTELTLFEKQQLSRPILLEPR